MDSQTDVEALREKLKAMPRKEVLQLCARAQVSASTVQKFRANLITEPGANKVLALIAALKAPRTKAKAKAAA
jgi:hypothetical protein